MSVERKKLVLGIMAALFMATSTLGFILSSGVFEAKSFTYVGKCLAEVNTISSNRALVYTLKEVNIPGVRNGPYVETILTDDILEVIRENNLLYWVDAIVEAEVNSTKIRGNAFVLGFRKPGDVVLLDCYVVVEGGTPVRFEAIEIPR